MRPHPGQPHRAAVVVLLVLAFAFVAFMTLRPTQSIVQTPVLCVFCGTLGGVDFILNVVLFVPLGMTLRWRLERWPSVVITGIATTVVIEAMQWRLISGRDASLGDLIANTLGTFIGGWLATAVFTWLSSTGPAARRYASEFGIVATLVVLASAFLLQPLVPRNPLWVQWKPLRTNMDPFEGDLLGVEVRGRAVHGADSFRSDELFDARARSISVRAHIKRPGPAPTHRPAIMVRTANGHEEGFFLAQWGDAAIFRSHTAVTRLKLRPILVGLDGAFSGSALEAQGRPFVIEGQSDPRAITLRRHAEEELIVSVRRTVGLGWAMLLHRDVALDQRWAIANSIWLAALVLPVSFFVIRSTRATSGVARTLAWWPVLLFVVVLLAIPFSGLSPLVVGEWLGVVAGIGGGWVLESSVRRPGDLTVRSTSSEREVSF